MLDAGKNSSTAINWGGNYQQKQIAVKLFRRLHDRQ
jgi:hypothetical protein